MLYILFVSCNQLFFIFTNLMYIRYSVFESAYITIFPFNITVCMIFLFSILLWFIFSYLNTYLFNLTKINYIFNIIYYLFEFFHTIVSSYLNKKNSIIFFPFLIYLFFFVFSANIYGLFPGFFASTSHLSFTLSLCFNIWLVIITLGFSIKTIKFFNIIIPKNVPKALVPFLIFIEFVSYFFRFVSLSLRLFANILAGHILIHVLTGATFKILLGLENSILYMYLFFLLFFAFTILFFFELIVAFLQGYILFILSVIYLTDLENNSH